MTTNLVQRTFKKYPSSKQSKIQSLIVKHLLDFGILDILLPDGIILEIGITQTDNKGRVIKADDYCYVQATREDKKMLLDSYNLGLSFADDPDIMLIEDTEQDSEGNFVRNVDVI